MLPERTAAVERALDAAQEWARLRQSSGVEPNDLLRGLLEEEEGRAVLLAVKAGLDLSAWRRAAGRRADAPPGEAPALPLSARVQTIFYQARVLAREAAGDSALASEQLLLTILREDTEQRAQLEEFGLSLPKLEALVLDVTAPHLHLDEPLLLPEAVEQIDTARILDAGSNRAREALRVLEDYCRFVLNDSFLSGELKRMRHELAQTLAGLSPGLLLEARETVRDVGTNLSADGEHDRYSLVEVAQVNFKRLQEALRSLEEFGKLQGPDMGQRLEKLRYLSYTLERALVLGAEARQRLADARLYVLVAGSECTAALDWTIQEAAGGGAQIIQLREKRLDDRSLLGRARQVRQWTRAAGVLFILNDRPDIARLAEADGVHLGQDNLPVKEARRIMGPDALIGVSTHDLFQVRQAVLDGASYLGVGPVFASRTKEFSLLAGLEFVRQAAAETSLPSFVLGGINRETIGAVVGAGGRRVAVSQAICKADDPRQAALELRRALENS